ncbi:P-loop NTPase fold protein [Siphonobacter aquaeclarae]|uniref:KAP family P-loop domain-containing protein n=1 Tax=Siphonobacter aquaeclarae TaxID=563176 RepID=A0A1G9T115_9BACT|nr:P-loop NTPase fold protein [Siphonobacter aquaeclarae]SDM41340.1 KAP family P-loop domain-containing protein [Siphonobacter aquaeclarae]
MSTRSDEPAVDIEQQIHRFEKHLSLPDNERIIVSGPFGSGKSYFLRKMFDTFKEKYEVFSISPVNYSISPNKDIFELIKYDILFQMIKKEISFEEHDFSLLLTSQMAVINSKKTQKAIADFILICLEKFTLIGKDFIEIYKKFKEIIDSVKEYHKKIQIDDKIEIEDYLDKIRKDISNPSYGEDQFMTIIKKYITKYYTEEPKKPDKNLKYPILIIDDLDRIDPEHIFRILNIFSAHIDWQSNSTIANKFGFTHVVLVCDIVNIRSVYSSKYGAKTDFSGYIDKFYSHYIFFHSITTRLSAYLENIITTISYSKTKYFIDKKQHEILVILKNLTNYGYLNIRKLRKLHNLDIIHKNIKLIGDFHFVALDIFIYHEILSSLVDPIEVIEPLISLRRIKSDLDFEVNDVATKQSLNFHYISACAVIHFVSKNRSSPHETQFQFDLAVESMEGRTVIYSFAGKFKPESKGLKVKDETEHETSHFTINYMIDTINSDGKSVLYSSINTLDLMIATYKLFQRNRI